MTLTINAAALDYGKLFSLPNSQGVTSYAFRQAVPDNDVSAKQAVIGWVDSNGNDVTCFTVNQKYYAYTVEAATRHYLNLNIATPATTNTIIPGFPSFTAVNNFASTVTIWVFRSAAANNYSFNVFNNNVTESAGVTLAMIFPEGGNYQCGVGTEEGGLSTGLIIAIVVVGILLLVIIIVVIVTSRKSSKSSLFEDVSTSQTGDLSPTSLQALLALSSLPPAAVVS